MALQSNADLCLLNGLSALFFDLSFPICYFAFTNYLLVDNSTICFLVVLLVDFPEDYL